MNRPSLGERVPRAAAEFWQKLATRSQSNLYFALVFLPRDRREAFRDVYRFLRAADDVADSGLPTTEIREKLLAWRHELDAVYAGHATHPIAQRLFCAVHRFRLTRGYFETILAALEEDIEPRRFATYPELERWCEAMSSTLGYLCLEILGCQGPGPKEYARDMGVALQLANIVRDVAEDARRGHLYLPLDVLEDAGCDPRDILCLRYSPGFAQAQARMSERARALVARARRNLTRHEARRLIVPEIWADVYLALLDLLEQGGYDVFLRPPYLRRRRKLAIAARRWLRESSCAFRHRA